MLQTEEVKWLKLPITAHNLEPVLIVALCSSHYLNGTWFKATSLAEEDGDKLLSVLISIS